MNKFGRILVGVDPHVPSTAAAALGARLAAGSGAALELYTPVYNSQVSLAHFESRERLRHAQETLVERHRQRLEAQLAELEFEGSAECCAAWDHPPEEALIRRVMERAADLLIVSLPPGEAAGGRPLSSREWQLVRHCPAPVLLTRGATWREHPVVVAAIDPTGRHGRRDELDIGILTATECLVESAGGVAHALHAWQKTLRAIIGTLEVPLAPDTPEAAAEAERHHREAIYQVLGAARAAPARVVLVEGRPEQVLPAYCREAGADVVVMGAIARNPFGRILIGSTAERVLEHLPCDLLVVKPDSFRTPVSRERWPRDDAATPILGVPGI
jgi:universal stress protein E